MPDSNNTTLHLALKTLVRLLIFGVVFVFVMILCEHMIPDTGLRVMLSVFSVLLVEILIESNAADENDEAARDE